MIYRIALIIVCLFSLVSCGAYKDIREPTKFAPHSMISEPEIIFESQQQVKKSAKYGPKPFNIDSSDLRDSLRVQIDKEEAFDYVNVQEDGTFNLFSIDLNLENVDIRVFAEMLAKLTGINVLVSDEVEGVVNAKLNDVMWPNALDAILKMKSLAKYVDNESNIIRIHSQQSITQIEAFERQRREDLQRSILLEKASEALYTEVFKLFYNKPSDVKSILQSVLGISGEGRSDSSVRNVNAQITVDERMNQIIVKATKGDLALIDKVIRRIDSRTKQVFIEAFIVEVSDDFEKELGTRLGMNFDGNTINNAFNNKNVNVRATGLVGTAADEVTAGDNNASLFDFAAGAATSGIGLLFGIGSTADLKFELTALEDEGLTKVLSNPRIFTLDNQEATIFQGDEIPYTTVSDSGTQIEFKEAGLKLAVTPTVVGDGNLMLAIKVNKDTADTSIDNPPITKSEINTNLVTQDGTIVVIGGIYSQTRATSSSKVPVLGDIPVAGKLFRNDRDEDDKQELMVFIAPQII